MACYYSQNRDMLILKCDGCGKAADLYKGETDRLLKHDWMKEHGWKVRKHGDRWTDICPECLKALQEQKRNKWLATIQ